MYINKVSYFASISTFKQMRFDTEGYFVNRKAWAAGVPRPSGFLQCLTAAFIIGLKEETTTQLHYQWVEYQLAI